MVRSTLFTVFGLLGVVTARATDVDLGDLAVGGNGLGSARAGLGIKIQSGQVIPPGVSGGQSCCGGFFRALDGAGGAVNIPAVDGVFRMGGLTQITTSGKLFGFGNDYGTTFDAIRNALAVYNYPITLNDLPGVERRGLGIHSNGGITFDLDIIRQTYPDITRTRGVAGIGSQTNGSSASVVCWIVVDGVVRYHQTFAGQGLNNEAYCVPLGPTDRFLTFAVADDGSTFFDHGVFADAVLCNNCVPAPTCDPNFLGLCPLVQEAKLLPLPDGDGQSTAWFGYSVAIDGDLAVVGAPVWVKNANWPGTVYVNRRTAGRWQPEAKLVAEDLPPWGFGSAVDVSGSTIAAVHYLEDGVRVFGQQNGAWTLETILPGRRSVRLIDDVLATVNGDDATIYLRSSGQWRLHANLPCEYCSWEEHFGDSFLDFSGGMFVGGAEIVETAYVYADVTGAPFKQAVLTASDSQGYDMFGASVAIEGDVVLIGAPWAENGTTRTGVAYIFERAGNEWAQTARLDMPDVQENGRFGHAVALKGGCAFVGAIGYDLPGKSNAGAVFEYRRGEGTWRFHQRITAADADAGDTFGFALRTDGDRLIAGARLDDDAGGNDGSAYIFKLPCLGDMNCDGAISQADLAEVLATYGCTCCRDIDGDFDVDQADLAGLLSVYNQPCPE